MRAGTPTEVVITEPKTSVPANTFGAVEDEDEDEEEDGLSESEVTRKWPVFADLQ